MLRIKEKSFTKRILCLIHLLLGPIFLLFVHVTSSDLQFSSLSFQLRHFSRLQHN